MSKNIAIDGPSGAGKSTLSRALAARLGYVYVDTGAIYRCVGLYVYEKGVDPADKEAVAALLPEIRVEMKYVDGLQRMFLQGRDVTKEIRLPEISQYASTVSAIPAVRSHLLEMQRSIAREENCIMDGRDIGTVVLPKADVKIFLHATAEERARRRFKELKEKGVETDFDTVLREMRERDLRDSSRDTAPLRAAEDAISVDTTEMDFDSSLQFLLGIIREKLGEA